MPQLDGLRAFAVLAVLYTHFLPEEYWLFDVYWGDAGVRLFFVLSGFLITRILLREKSYLDSNAGNKKILIRQFYIRRYLRLTPIFLLTLIIATIINIPETRETFWWHVFYASNFNFAINNSWQGSVAHFWTLSVEEQFYLIWPLLVLFLTHKSLTRLIYIVIPLTVVYRISARLAGIDDIPIWVMLPDSMDALCLGALVAIYVRDYNLTTGQKWLFLVAGTGFLFWLFAQMINGPEILKTSEFGRTGLAVFFSWVVLRASEGHQGLMGRILESPMLIYIGKLSYGIYVIHLFVFIVLKKNLFSFTFINSLSPIWMAIIAGIVTIVLSALSWHFLEKPINRYRKSLEYQPRQTGA